MTLVRSGSLLATVAASAAALFLNLACAHRTGSTTPPRAPVWIDAPLADADAQAETERLRTLAASPASADAITRLDRLLDLLDAARFGQLDAARQALWSTLGDPPVSRGPQGTQAALTELLQAAWATEDRHALDDDGKRFVADFVMLVSVDLNHPHDTEALQIRTAAYRQLAATGHPRIADNAQWRLFDHVHGVLEATATAPPERRRDIAAHVLYTVYDEITDYLVADASGHRRDLPPAETLVEQLEQLRQTLLQYPRWQAIVVQRSVHDGEVAETALAVLPTTRRSTWPLVEVAAGTGRADPLAPVVLARAGEATIEPGTPTERTSTYDNERLTELLRAQMTRDGRGRLLLAADPMLPSPQLALLLAAVRDAAASTIDVAVLEPNPAQAESRRVTVLPVQVYRPDDPLAARPFRDARLHVHLDGRGPTLWADGKLVQTEGNELFAAAIDRARRAYPHESVATVSLSHDVLGGQLVELLTTLRGGRTPRLAAVAWLPDAPPPPATPQLATAMLDRRVASLEAAPAVRIDQPYPLREGDQVALDAFAEQVRLCSAELERPAASKRCKVRLSFAAGVLDSAEITASGADKTKRLAMQACVQERGATFRLREHRDHFSVTVQFVDGPATPAKTTN